MTSVAYANETVFGVVLILYLLAAFAGTVCFATSISYKLKPVYILPEIAFSAVAITLFCYYADAVKIRYFSAAPEEFAGSPCFMPTWSVIFIAIALLTLVAVWLVLVARKRLSSLTAMSVKEAIAALSSGLCFYDGTGRVLLLNEQIENECKELTGESLYDGKAFWTFLTEGKTSDKTKITQSEGSIIVEYPDGRATCYKRIEHDFNGKTVYEISGADVGYESQLKKEIEKKNENLQKMNARLRKYGEIVAEVTKERETLAARVKVHGNLGSLILRTKKALSQGGYDRAALVAAWNDVMSLIFASDEEEDKFFDAEKTAANVGVRIFYDGKRPKKGATAEKIFAAAAFECVVNTVRHADGDELYLTMTEKETDYVFTAKNNGARPTEPIKEGGGLSAIRTMTENAGGRMTVLYKPDFTLEITVPKETTDER